jgi:hypothetical protein
MALLPKGPWFARFPAAGAGKTKGYAAAAGKRKRKRNTTKES